MSTTPAPRRMSEEEMKAAKRDGRSATHTNREHDLQVSINQLISHIAALDAERAAVAGDELSNKIAEAIAVHAKCIPIFKTPDEARKAFAEIMAIVDPLLSPILIERNRRDEWRSLLEDSFEYMTEDENPPLELLANINTALRNSPGGEGGKQR